MEKVEEQYTSENMIYNAKNGNWGTVWEILKHKPEYVNCIPKKSSWAALHQAVYFSNIEAVQTLVEKYGADVNIVTKPNKDGVAEGGTSAIALAKKKEDLDIYEYLLTQSILQQPSIPIEDLLVRYHYYEEGTVEVTTEMLENGLGINTQSGLCFREKVVEEIFQDTTDIQEMIKNAKSGNWKKVWEILKSKPYIVNCVPEKSSWSALHQAIYFDDIQAVQKLVEPFGADIVTYTRPNNDGDAEPGTSATHLAKQRKNVDIFGYLIIRQLKQKELRDKDLSEFAVHENGTVYPFERYPLLQLTIASYKSLFSSSNQFEGNRRKHLSQVTFDIFQRFDENWEEVAIKIRNTLYGIYNADLKNLSNPKSKKKFFKRIIRLYTENSVYYYMRPALGRQHDKTYKPLATDLALAPFALTLSAILIHFKDLEPYSGITYRGVRKNVVDQYEVGTRIIFFSFISSSKQIKVAKKFANRRDTLIRGTLFFFHNNADKEWQPRSIEKCSEFPEEMECLYPLGAEFFVFSIDKTEQIITLKLLNSKV